MMDSDDSSERLSEAAAKARHTTKLRNLKLHRLNRSSSLWIVNDTSTTRTTFSSINQAQLDQRDGEFTTIDMTQMYLDGRFFQHDFLATVGCVDAMGIGVGNYTNDAGVEYDLVNHHQAENLVAGRADFAHLQPLIPDAQHNMIELVGSNLILSLFLREQLASGNINRRVHPHMCYTRLSTLTALLGNPARREATANMIACNFRMIVLGDDSGLAKQVRADLNSFLGYTLRIERRITTYPPMEVKVMFDNRFVLEAHLQDYKLAHHLSDFITGNDQATCRTSVNNVFVPAVLDIWYQNPERTPIYEKERMVANGLVAKVYDVNAAAAAAVLPAAGDARRVLVETTRLEHVFFLRLRPGSTINATHFAASVVTVNVFRKDGTLAPWEALVGTRYYLEPYVREARLSETRMFGAVRYAGKQDFQHLYNVSTNLQPNGRYHLTPPSAARNIGGTDAQYKLANKAVRAVMRGDIGVNWYAGGHAHLVLRIDMFRVSGLCFVNQVHVSPACDGCIRNADSEVSRDALKAVAGSMKAYMWAKTAEWSA